MFNLLTEPWIPLTTSDGDIVNASIGDALLEPQRWTGISTVNPVECIAIHRLLLAICHRAIGPGDLNQRSALLDVWPVERIEAYLDQWADRFDLFHTTHPFLQTPGLTEAGAQQKSWAKLATDRTSGHNRVLWDHSFDETPTPITAAEAARVLTACQQFTTEGLVKFPRTSGPRGPACGVLLVIATGDHLQQTLALNLLDQSKAQYQNDLPPWELDPPLVRDCINPQPIIPAGPVQRFTALPRLVLFIPRSDGTVTHMRLGAGKVQGPSPTPDPMTPMVAGKSGPMPLLLRQGRSFWRDFHALTGGEGSTAPAVTHHAATIKAMRLNYDPLELIVGGIANKNDKVLFWRLEFRQLSPQLLQQGAATSLAQNAVTLAETVSKDLTKALTTLFRNWVSSNGSGKSPSTADVSNLHQSTQAMAHYWAALEPEFWSLVDRLATGLSADEANTCWANTLQQTILQTWQHATDQLGQDGRALAAAAQADRDLGRVIAGSSGAETGRNNKKPRCGKVSARSRLVVDSP